MPNDGEEGPGSIGDRAVVLWWAWLGPEIAIVVGDGGCEDVGGNAESVWARSGPMHVAGVLVASGDADVDDVVEVWQFLAVM